MKPEKGRIDELVDICNSSLNIPEFKKGLSIEEHMIIDRYLGLRASSDNLFKMLTPHETGSIDDYLNRVIAGLGEVFCSSVNYWIDTHKDLPDEKIDRRTKKEKPISERFILKSHSSPQPLTPLTCDSKIFENTIKTGIPVIGKGKNTEYKNKIKAYMIQPTLFLEDKAVISLSGRNTNRSTDYNTIDLLALNYANDEIERKIRSIYSKTIDPLTKVNNRATGLSILEGINKSAIKDNSSYAVLMLDIDHFKSVNDTYGHKEGDVVLESMCELIKTHLRKRDLVSRYGGEEFLIGIIDVNEHQAYERADNLRKNINAGMNALLGKNITVSIGISTVYGKDDETDIIKHVNRADVALYGAKFGIKDEFGKETRNRVIHFYEGLTPLVEKKI